MATVLVTDGEQRAALAAVRSLGAAGHEVLVASRSGRSLAGASRRAAGDYALPDPLRDAKSFAGSVGELVRKEGIDVVLPIAEPSLLALLPVRDEIAACIPFPTAAQFQRICDKNEVMQIAEEIGIRVPKQIVLEDPASVDRLDSVRFPLVLKPSRSVTGTNAERIKTSVAHVADLDAAKTALRALPEAAFPVLAQERIYGPGIGIFLLIWNGRLLASFAHRRIREKPPSGGVSVLRESVAMDADLLHRSVRLLERFDWNGVAMVEYKRCDTTGLPYLMEINGRFWGSLQLAIDAGVDFPTLLVDAASGKTVTPIDSYREGVRSRWEWGDVDHLLARLRRSRTALDLPAEGPGRLSAVWDFVSGGLSPAHKSEVFNWSDPRPFLRESASWFRDLVAG